MPKCTFALFLGTPEHLSDNLLSNAFRIDRASPSLALGILHILVNLKLGSEEGRLDGEVSLVSRVQGSIRRGVGRETSEMKDGINRGIRKADGEWGVAGESIDHEFTTGMILCGGNKGDVGMHGAIRGFDEHLGEISVLVALIVEFLLGVVREGDVHDNRIVPGLENQEVCGGKISEDDASIGPDFAALNVQSLYKP